jgi:hypothetical protein
VTLKARSSDWTRTATSDANGEFRFGALTLGDYSLTAACPGFTQGLQELTLVSGTEPVLHLQLQVAPTSETVTVSGAPEAAPTDTATPTTLVDRTDIDRTPGAASSQSLAMITDFVPGSYLAHDMLHVRGGHQTQWLVDGVPVINTAIAATVGPQFDPMDIDYVEVNRGSYGAEFGDRTYGVFNVVPRTGFEGDREGEAVLSLGNYFTTDDHLSLGSHSERFAYYGSVSANRSDLGLQAPVPQVVHDSSQGLGSFGSLIFNADPSNQLRLILSFRKDNYQVPYDPNPDDIENGAIPANSFVPQWPSLGLRDEEHELDGGAILSFVHTFSPTLTLTVSPFYHYNASRYLGPPGDTPVATTEERSVNYLGGQAAFQANLPKNNLQVGVLAFHEQDSQTFQAIFNNGSLAPTLSDVEHPSGDLQAFFVDEKFKPWSWLTLSGGLRPTRFSLHGGFTETALGPRFGATLTVPRLGWTFRAFYGRYYQAPPLATVSGPALSGYIAGQSLGFVPLHGESDRERQFGVIVPWKGWTLDITTFRTEATNYLDHNNIGTSSIFLPLTISEALIRAWEVTLRSPRFAHRGGIHLAYSNQVALGSGTITGGLTDFAALPDLTPLDHDQRNTLSVGGDVGLPGGFFASGNFSYGSGFTNGLPGAPFPGAYLPAHSSVDLALGRDIGKKISASLTVLNLADQVVELDNSLTFGGFHYSNPRQVFVRVRYRFHY